jgi:heme/copper-type cytochrome/quinol oxidase subunit 3
MQEDAQQTPSPGPGGPAVFLRFLLSGPQRVRQTLEEKGPAEASIVASLLSLVLLGISLAGSLFVTCAAPCALIAASTVTDANVANPITTVIMLPVIVIALIMLLAALTGLLLAVAALFNPEEKKSRALLAFGMSMGILLVYGVLALGIAAFAG